MNIPEIPDILFRAVVQLVLVQIDGYSIIGAEIVDIYFLI